MPRRSTFLVQTNSLFDLETSPFQVVHLSGGLVLTAE